MYAALNGRSLVGRPDELSVLVEAMTGAADRTRLVTVTGAAGIGKSRLLAEFQAHARTAPGVIVGWDSAALDAPIPQEALLVLVLDDLDTADLATVARLERALSRPPRANLLLVLGYRPRQTPTRLLAAVAAAHLQWQVVHVRLGPLARDVVERLLPATLCASHRMAVGDQSRGNPRYLEFLLSLCDGETCRGESPLVAPAAPEALAPVRVELEGLSPGANLVSRAAAVVGETFDLDLTATVAETGRDAVLVALDEMLAADLVKSAGTPGTFRFRHPVLRAVAYRCAPQGWRMGAHARAAEAMRSHNEPAVRVAEHVQLAGGVDGAGHTEVLVEAAQATELRAPTTATTWYRAALRTLGDAPEHRARRLELLLALTRTALRTGDTEAAHDALTRRDELLSGGRDEEAAAAEVVEYRAALAVAAGQYTAARAMLRSTVARRGPQADSTRLRLALAATTAWDTGWKWSEDALLGAIGGGDPVLQSLALGIHAVAALNRGTPDIARRSATEAARVLDRLADEDLARELTAVCLLGWAETHLERYADAERHFTRGLAVGRAVEQRPMIVAMLAGLGAVELRRGRLRPAMARVEEALPLAHTPGHEDLLAMVLMTRAHVLLTAGDAAASLADSSAAIAAVSADSPWWRRAHVIKSMAELALDDAEECLETAQRAGGCRFSDLPIWDHPLLYEAASHAALILGRREQATELAGRARATAEALGLAGPRGLAELAMGRLAEAPAERLAHALNVVSGSAGLPVLTGLGHLLAAQSLLELGEAAQTREHAGSAERIAEDTGADGLRRAAVAVREQAEADQAPATTPPGEQFVLSQREYEISCLLSEGRTNRQIARQLEVSHKTVETHLGRIFTRLNVCSRAEIANLFGRDLLAVRPRRTAATG